MAEQYDRLLLRRSVQGRGEGRGLAHRGDFDVRVGIARRLEHARVISGQFGHLAAALDRRDRDAVLEDFLRRLGVGGLGVDGRGGEQGGGSKQGGSRSEESRGGEECASTCSIRWATYR